MNEFWTIWKELALVCLAVQVALTIGVGLGCAYNKDRLVAGSFIGMMANLVVLVVFAAIDLSR